MPGWVAALAAPQHRQLAWRLPVVLAGLMLASGRRTDTAWWRARFTTGLKCYYYYFLDVVVRKADDIAAVLLRLTTGKVPADVPPRRVSLSRVVGHPLSGTLGLP